MSTRAQVRFATREAGVSFDKHPDVIHAQFYKHSDGYPEGLGLDIADYIMNSRPTRGWEIESLTAKHGDLEFIYYIWQYPGKETWISIFEVGSFAGYCEHCEQELPTGEDRCVFVGLPTQLIDKYKINTNDDG
tara:strand:- start:587 stop:985 length:399 start_codon:yes stop_codon:yes gene_type:complete